VQLCCTRNEYPILFACNELHALALDR